MDGIESIEGVCEIERVAGARATANTIPRWLIEVPHGATDGSHFEATRNRLVGKFPDDLKQFFYVNTDVGSVECARHVARMLADPGGDERSVGAGPVLLVRGLVPRTFIDCNRVIESGPAAEVRNGMTPGLPEYVTSAEDIETLTRMHAQYHAVARRAYRAVCGNGGTALMLHTYAPRSIGIDRVDDGIVAALHRAYEPGVYETWDKRPDVDVITEAKDGTKLAPAGLVEKLREAYAQIGVAIGENATYRLYPETMGYVFSRMYAGRVACIEISRALLADPFTPFEEMRIDDERARKMAAPIAAACLELARS
jgi:hypothetical protein